MFTSCLCHLHGLGVVIGAKSMVAAGANLLPGTNVPGGQLWGGNPAVFMRDLTAVDFAALETVRTYAVSCSCLCNEFVFATYFTYVTTILLSKSSY